MLSSGWLVALLEHKILHLNAGGRNFTWQLNEPRHEKTSLRGSPTRSDTNRAVQLLKMA